MKLFKRHTIVGRDGSPYMTRYMLGWFRLHIFYRGDDDPDPHDHPWAFWTFPLISYVEEFFTPSGDTWIAETRVVRAFRLHHRPATHTHRVIGRYDRTDPSGAILTRKGKIVTLVLRVGKERSWGFLKHRDGNWCWVAWRNYIFGNQTGPC